MIGKKAPEREKKERSMKVNFVTRPSMGVLEGALIYMRWQGAPDHAEIRLEPVYRYNGEESFVLSAEWTAYE